MIHSWGKNHLHRGKNPNYSVKLTGTGIGALLGDFEQVN